MESVEVTYDNIANVYDSSFKSKLNEVENKIAFDKVRPFTQGRVLDLGCGTGLIHDYIKISDYTGVDISESMLSIARNRSAIENGTSATLRHEYYKRDFMDCRDLSEFDSVISTFGSTSYCMNPHLLSKELKFLLRPGGKFQLHVLSWRYYWRASHISSELPFVGYSSKLLRAAYKDFRNVRVSGFNLMNNAAMMPFVAATLGKKIPDLFYYLVVEGEL